MLGNFCHKLLSSNFLCAICCISLNRFIGTEKKMAKVFLHLPRETWICHELSDFLVFQNNFLLEVSFSLSTPSPLSHLYHHIFSKLIYIYISGLQSFSNPFWHTRMFTIFPRQPCIALMFHESLLDRKIMCGV